MAFQSRSFHSYTGVAAVLMTSAAANAAQLAALVGDDTIAWVDTMQKKATGMTKVSGIAGSLVGIDVRPADGMLYALSAEGVVYTVDTATGKATMKSKLETMLKPGTWASVWRLRPCGSRWLSFAA